MVPGAACSQVGSTSLVSTVAANSSIASSLQTGVLLTVLSKGNNTQPLTADDPKYSTLVHTVACSLLLYMAHAGQQAKLV